MGSWPHLIAAAQHQKGPIWERRRTDEASNFLRPVSMAQPFYRWTSGKSKAPSSLREAATINQGARVPVIFVNTGVILLI